MTAKPIDLFVNPAAGRGRAEKRLAEIRRLMEASGASVVIHESAHIGDLETRVRRLVCAGTERVIVAGGDGSVHEAVNGIMDADAHAALGVIPTGTGNDFAKAAGIPLGWRDATSLLARRIADDVAKRTIDVGRMNDRYFANGAGIGLDAKVNRIASDYDWPIGDLVYLVAIFRTMLDSIATPEMRLETDSLNWNGPVTLASVSNGPWIGGMFHIAPMAKNDDGKLELMIAAPVTRRRILGLLPKLIKGEHLDEIEVEHASIRHLTVRAASPVPSHLDGEVQPLQTDFEFEVVPGALPLLQ
jgi:YegS/Rv2252/BmrU family lipid kinase